MTTMIVALGFTAAAMAAMAVGVIFSNRELQGSCGGTGKDCLCEIEKRRACNAFRHAGLASGATRATAWSGDRPQA